MATEAILPPSVHAVRVGDDIVFLDVTADRYLCWPDAEGLDLSVDRRRLSISDQDALVELESAGLVSRTDRPISGNLIPPKPSRDLWPDRGSFFSRGDAWTLARASYDASVVYPRKRFADLVAFGASHPPGAFPDDEPGPEMVRWVGSFHRWADWTPGPTKCLIRSFMLLHHLRRHGLDARWVFAVRTWPFEAHCWLQAGHAVLDDARDRLAAYAPILVV